MANRNPSTALDVEAADWVVRLGKTPLEAQERHAFDQWLAQSPQHRRAFEFAQWAWATMGQVALPSTTVNVPDARNASRKPARRRRLPLALAASVLLGLGVLGIYREVPWIALGADHYTQVGEVRRIELPDGSGATLNTYSAIDVEYSSNVRGVRLLAGTAKFDVASVQDATARPFTVTMPGGSATALGTSFVVTLEDSGATVGVIEHSVAVSIDSTQSQVVNAGQQIRYEASGGLGPLGELNLAQSTAWERGHLLFNDVPLRDAVAQINRYRKQPIVIANTVLAGRKITGIFRLSELDEAAQFIAAELDVQVTTVPGLLSLLH